MLSARNRAWPRAPSGSASAPQYHERGCLNEWKHRTYVVVSVDHRRRGGGSARAHLLHPREHLREVRIAESVRRHELEPPRPLAVTPPRARLQGRKIAVGRVEPVWVVRGSEHPRPGVVQDERAHSIGMHRREQHRDHAAVAVAVQRRSLRSDRVHHREQVFYLLFELRRTAGHERIRHAKPTPIQHDQPREPGEMFVVRFDHRIDGARQDAAQDSWHPHQVNWAIAPGAIRNRHAVGIRVETSGNSPLIEPARQTWPHPTYPHSLHQLSNIARRAHNARSGVIFRGSRTARLRRIDGPTDRVYVARDGEGHRRNRPGPRVGCGPRTRRPGTRRALDHVLRQLRPFADYAFPFPGDVLTESRPPLLRSWVRPRRHPCR